MPLDMPDPHENQAISADFPGTPQHFIYLLMSGFRNRKLNPVEILETIGQHRLLSLEELVSCLFDGYELQEHKRVIESANPIFRQAAGETLSHARNLGHIGPDEAQYLSSVFGVELKNVQFPDA